MRTAIGVQERVESAFIRRRFDRTANGHLRLWELAFLLSARARPTSAIYERSRVLASNLASVTEQRKKRRTRALTTDRMLQALVTDLAAAWAAAGMTQEEVSARMWTTKSVMSRLGNGVCRPTLSTIEKYAVDVGALVEIRVRISP